MGRGYGGGRRGREIIYLSLYCHYQNDTCIKMGSDESHFNVSLIASDKVTRQCPQTTTFEEKRESKRIRIEVLLAARPNRLIMFSSLGWQFRSPALPVSYSPAALPPCSVYWAGVCMVIKDAKLQELVYDIFPPTSACRN